MAEAKDTNTQQDAEQSAQHLYMVDLSSEKVQTAPLFDNQGVTGDKAPPWLRPFFSLRTQLTASYCLILCAVIIAFYMLDDVQASRLYTSITILSIIIVGTLLAFIVNTMLLRPLWRVTDASQAIALGDLKQRERLPLRLPPQDEIDRLAGSLNEMVTRLERAEEMQERSEERFKRFFSDASHQLRTPLTSLRGFTEVLIRGAKDDPEMSKRVLALMKGEAERMTVLINDLLIMARLDDRRTTKQEYVDLLAIAVNEIEKTRARSKDSRLISLSILTEQRLGIKGDTELIHQLFFVLLDNALKYGQPAPEGSILIKLDRDASHVVISIKDNGEGITPKDLSHIFDAFYRGHQKRPDTSKGSTPQIVGTGLGLTIAAAVVRSHNGLISVYSEPGKGTTFTVKLPCVN